MIAKKKKKQYLNLWNWIFVSVLLLGIFVGSVLVYQVWNRQKKVEKLQKRLQELQDQAQRQYQLQETQ
jgi:uncharacterized membrane-anchored protein YhcB (DUF1043 family)